MIKRCKSLCLQTSLLSLNKLDPVPIWYVLFGMYWKTAVMGIALSAYHATADIQII